LVPPFFVLSSEYRRALLEEIYYLVKHANFTYHDVVHMPIFERRFFIDKITEEFRKRNEKIEEMRNKRNQ